MCITLQALSSTLQFRFLSRCGVSQRSKLAVQFVIRLEEVISFRNPWLRPRLEADDRLVAEGCRQQEPASWQESEHLISQPHDSQELADFVLELVFILKSLSADPWRSWQRAGNSSGWISMPSRTTIGPRSVTQSVETFSTINGFSDRGIVLILETSALSSYAIGSGSVGHDDHRSETQEHRKTR